MSCCIIKFEISCDEISHISQLLYEHSVSAKNSKGASCEVVSNKFYILEICGSGNYVPRPFVVINL
jgi:hypothetical protein